MGAVLKSASMRMEDSPVIVVMDTYSSLILTELYVLVRLIIYTCAENDPYGKIRVTLVQETSFMLN